MPGKLKKLRKKFIKKKIKQTEPEFIHVSLSSRTCNNWVLYVVYRFFRIFYASFWFYFIPFSTIFISYWLPYYLVGQDLEEAEKSASTTLDTTSALIGASGASSLPGRNLFG